MSDAHTDGCARGAVRYQIEGEPMAMGGCQCQKKSGTSHRSYLTFPSQEKVMRGHLWDHVNPAVTKFDNMPPM